MPQTVSKEYLVQTRAIFYCHIKIKIPKVYGEAILEACFDLMEQIDRTYNSHQPGSYFSRINQQAGRWVTVDDTCIQMLHQLTFISSLTQGSYDISCMPLLRLWGFYKSAQEKVSLPTFEALSKTLEHVDYRSIEIKENFVKIKKGQELSTGSFLKAFAVDQVVAFLSKKGITDAVINAGGSTIRGLNDESHQQWKINIPPAHNAGETTAIALSNQCFSLSGTANNHRIIDSKTYGHIINSKTGYPVLTAQVGVISSTAFLGDILSTALFAVEQEEVQEVIEKLQAHFEFTYYRIEQSGNKTATLC